MKRKRGIGTWGQEAKQSHKHRLPCWERQEEVLKRAPWDLEGKAMPTARSGSSPGAKELLQDWETSGNTCFLTLPQLPCSSDGDGSSASFSLGKRRHRYFEKFSKVLNYSFSERSQELSIFEMKEHFCINSEVWLPGCLLSSVLLWLQDWGGQVLKPITSPVLLLCSERQARKVYPFLRVV